MKRYLLIGSAAGVGVVAGLTFAQAREGAPPQLGVAILASLLMAPIGALTAVAIPLAIRNATAVPFLRKAWILGSLFFACVGLSNGWSARADAISFAVQGDSTAAQVLSTHPEDHNTIAVQYQVAGKPYTQRIGASGLARDLEPGATVAVYYLKDEPTQVTSRRPEWRPLEVFVGTALAAFLLPTVLVGFGGTWLRARRSLIPEQ